MPYKGDASGIYGSGELFYYIKASKFTFGIPLAILIVVGLIVWLIDSLLKSVKVKKEWLMEMLVIYLPFLIYFAAHSYVWWKGQGNSVGLIRVIAAIVPAAAVLGVRAWNGVLKPIPVGEWWKKGLTVLLCIFLLTVPHRVYKIPVPLGGTQVISKKASLWLKQSDYFQNRIHYYDPFFPHFMNLNPYDKERVHEFVYNRDEPTYKIEDGEIVIWDAHFSPNEGQLPLENLMDNEGFRLIHLTRDKEPFKVLGGYLYEIYIFQRITTDDGEDNHDIYNTLLEEILTP